MRGQRIIFLILVLSLVLQPLFFRVQIAEGGIGEAVTYLQNQNENPWITMALFAVGEASDIDYLKSINGSSAIELAAPVLAITAAGEDPRTFPTNDLIAKLKGYYADGQIGDASTLNDDIFGLLALLSAGEPIDDVVVSNTRDFILQSQSEDGGWGFGVNGGSDTNMASATIMALIESGVSADSSIIQNAIAYLRSAQNADGGFPYDPHGMWGTDSDASSDAWVISAIESVDGEINDWVIEGVGGPIEHLLSLQTGEGYFQYQTGTGEDSFTPITTSYAVIALAGKGYPVNSISYNPPEPNSENDDEADNSGKEERSRGGGGGTSKNKKTTENITDTDTMTLTQLRAELDRLIALLAQLQAAATANSEVGELTRNLGVGSIGEDVRMLQRYLNNHGFVLAISGPAAPGSETTFFGELTRATLARFQAANDITPAVGFFGPITRMYINAHP